MSTMEKMDTVDTSSTEPVALQMWKIVHSPIVSMYRNLGDSCDNWENYISFIINSSMDIYDIFIPRTNSNSTTKQNEIIEQKYFSFALWFQGRIFYILSCDRLKSVHRLSVELQLKILDTLHLHQPNYYQKLSLEYVKALETILRNSYNKDQTLITDSYIIEQFSLENNLNIDSLELHPVYIEIVSDTKPKSLVGYLITILSHILSLEVQVCLKNKLFMNTWKCFILIIENCEIPQKLEVINNITMIIKKMGLHTVYDISVKEYFTNFFSVLDYFISVSHNLLTPLETKSFFSVFNNLLKVVIQFNATKDTEINLKLFKICQYFICDETKNQLSTEQTVMLTNSSTNDLTDLSCDLIKIILLQTPELHLDVQKWLSDIQFKKSSSILKIMQVLIKYEIVNNLNTNFPNRDVSYIDVRKTSTTWNRLYNILKLYTNNDVKPTTENLKVVLEILITTRIVDIELNNILYGKPHKFIFIYFKSDSKIISNIIDLIKTNKITGEEETLPVLMLIIEIFGSILKLQDFSKRNEIITEKDKPTADSYREMQIMIGIISLPFLKSLNWSNSDPNVSQVVKSVICSHQTYSIEIRKKCMQTLLMGSLYCSNFDVKNNNIVEWVNRVFQSGVKNNKDVLLEIILCCPNLIFNNIGSTQTVLNTFLYPFLKSEDALVLQTVAKTLRQMICILGGNYFVTENYDADNKTFYTKVICQDCDIVKIGDEYYYKENKNIIINLCQFKKKQNIFERKESILEPFMKLFDKDNSNLIINMVNLLPYLAKHMPRFYTLEITKKWIHFISSPDLIVRKKMSNIIGNIIVNIQENLSHDDQLKNDILQLCVQNIINTAKKSLNSTDFELQETMLHMTKEIGCLNIASQNIHILCLKLLVHYIMNPLSTVSAFASSHFNDVATSLNMTGNDIYIQYKKDICRTMADNIVYNFEVYSIDFATSLQKISITLGFSGSRDFVNIDHHHILPYLIPWFLKAPVTKPLLNEIAELLTVEPSELLINNFCNIYPYVYLYETTEIYTECMNFIESTTKQNISSLKKKNFKVIFNELLLHYYCKQKRVLEGLRELLKEDLEIYNDDLDDVNKIADLLQPRFQGVLVYFDIKLVSKKVAICIKRKALESLPEIIKLMGPKHITPLRYKVIATLRTTLILNDGVFPQLNCLAWSAFVKCCDIESLGPLLSTIFVSLLPQFHKCPQIINGIFKYLIVDNEKKIENFIQDLFFVSETNISNEIKVIVEKNMKQKCKGGLKNQLKFFLKYINHDSIEVRVFGVKFLTRLLLKNRQALDDIILGNNGLDPIIVELLDMLTMGCREGDECLQIACSECIGELGAIEPSHLPRRCIQTSETFIFYISDENFVINALYELTRAFQSEKRSQNMNCFALAIQEILKTYSVSPDSTSDDGRALWNNLPENQRQIMVPLLSSRYTIAVDSQPSVHLLFGSNAIASFTDWINSWTSNLIFFIQNPEKKCLFQQCLPSLKRDMRTLMFFLPHIIVHALLESSDSDRQHIYEEMIAVLSCFENKKNINAVKTDWKPLKPDMSRHIPDMRPPEEAIQIKSSKVVYMLLDFLARWLREWQHSYCPIKSTGQDVDYGIISSFIGRFCKLKVAESNYRCDEFPRALMYLEDYVDGNQDGFKEHLGFFARIYAELDEPDGVAGIRAIQQTEPSLEELILAHEVSGQLQDAATCYERMAQQQCSSPYFFQGMVRCYLDLDNPSTACRIAEGVIRSNPEYSPLMFESEAEPFWRLGQYNELAKLLARPELNDNTTWGVRIGRILLHFRNGERNQFHSELECTRKGLVSLLGAASLEEGAYQHGYPQIMKLHILNELQKTEEMVYRVKEIVDKQSCDQAISELFNEWDLRYRLVHSSVRVVEPMLCLRRIALQQAKNLLSSHTSNVGDLIGKQIGRLWLKSAQVARGACMYQQAYTYLLNAEQYKLKDLFVEKAKLHWKRGEQEVAFNTLKRGIEEYFPNASIFKTLASNERIEDRKLCAEAKLLIAKYNDATVNVDIEVNLHNFKEAVEVYREWETSLVKLAQYYDKILSTMPEEDRDRNIGGDIQVHIINYFGKSLLFGSRFIYQSMPRILSIWLDFGTKLRNARVDTDVENRRNTLLRMTKLIDTFLERLPSYMFLSAFSQIISRICHPQVEVQLKLKSIIVTLIIKYPQQSLWMMMAVCKSSYSIRMKRCQEILQDHRIKSAQGLTKLIKDFMHLAEKLIELCNKGISEGVSKTTVTALVRALPRLLSTADFSQIMLPVQQFRKMVLPNETHSLANHDPFPKRMVYIAGICDEVDILQSLQRPRKITLRGSDGKKYIQMLKPKDDLRKDFRLMEFNDVVNQCLYMEPESRQRRLYIRTYSVVPLNEECGLIEWVPNLVGLRPILINLYKQKGLFTTNKEMRTLMCNVRDTLQKKKKMYEEELLPRHPPVFSEWFRYKFPDPYSWYQARTAYIRTTAVMSMVGYILGLGDRHGENILFDSTNGDTVHVDFNCLFNKGETFDWPERVPFRLTHNMVKAMGPLGVEGMYRKSCEITLRVLRMQKDTLMSIVRPFVYDPLVSWPRNQLGRGDAANAERTNEQAVENIRSIELRLQGMKNRASTFSLSLSVEGQTNNLITEATSVENLCQMYIGWGPFL